MVRTPFAWLRQCALCAMVLAGLGSVMNTPCLGVETYASAEPPLEVMAGEMLMVGFRGTSLPPEKACDSPTLQALRLGKVGGLILFSCDSQTGGPRNVDSPAQVKTLITQLRYSAAQGPSAKPLLVAVDQEGGKVQRLSRCNGFRDWPSALQLGYGKPDDTYASALNMGSVLAEAGFNLNFAPTLDIHCPDSPAIGKLERAFSADPALITSHARAFIQGMNDAGVMTVLKHFPGHGSSSRDTHNDVADVSTTWNSSELLPYQTLLAEGFDGMVMAAHVRLKQYGTLPASLSPEILTGLLRGELGWQGVVVTDDLQMKAAVEGRTLKEQMRLAIVAGADLLLYGNNLEYDPLLAFKAHDALMELIREGSVSPQRVRQSWQRLVALKSRLSQ